MALLWSPPLVWAAQLASSPHLALEARMVQTYHAQEEPTYSDAAESDEGSWYAGPE